jgi:hypothetical protein
MQSLHNALGVKLRLAATESRPRTLPPTARCSFTLGWTDRAPMRPALVLAALRYGGYLGAALRHAAGDRRCRPQTCGSDRRAWRRDRPGALLTGHCLRPVAATRHTTPLAGRPSGADLMRRTPLRPGGEVLLPVG